MYFLRKQTREMDREVTGFSPEATKALMGLLGRCKQWSVQVNSRMKFEGRSYLPAEPRSSRKICPNLFAKKNSTVRLRNPESSGSIGKRLKTEVEGLGSQRLKFK